MNAALRLVAGFFYETRGAALRAGEQAEAAVAPAVAVLAAPADAMAAGAALGLGLVRLRGAPAVLVCVWSDGPDPGSAWRAPAAPAARRLVAGLAARGHDAHPRGRLAVVRLAEDEPDAVGEAGRAAAAAGGVPTVVALGRPRGAEFDRALLTQDLVVVAARSDDAGLARLALSRLAGPALAAACQLPSGAVPRMLAASGAGLTRAFGESVTQALSGLE